MATFQDKCIKYPHLVPLSPEGPGLKSTREYVYRTIRNWIVHLKLPPGAALADKELSGLLGVSQTPVREAFLRLAQESVLDVFPQRGTYVSKISIVGAGEAKLVRRVLERELIAGLRLPLKKDFLLRMQHNVRMQKMLNHESAREESAIDFFRHDDEFHRMFFEYAGLMRVWEMIHQFSTNSDRIRVLFLQAERNWNRSISQHQELCDAASGACNRRLLEVWDSHCQIIDTAFAVARERFPDYFA